MRTSFVPVQPMVPLAAVHVKGPTTCVQQGVFTRKPVSRGDAGIGGPGALAPSSPSGAGGYVLAPSAPVALRGTAVSDWPGLGAHAAPDPRGSSALQGHLLLWLHPAASLQGGVGLRVSLPLPCTPFPPITGE